MKMQYYPVRRAHRSSIVEVTVVHQLNQGVCKKRAVHLFLLDFLLHFCVKTKVENNIYGCLSRSELHGFFSFKKTRM